MDQQEKNKLTRDYIEPIPAQTAISEIDHFRQSLGNMGHGVWYFPADIKRYIEVDFPEFVRTHPNTGKEYVWVVGHYFKIHNGRISFCVIPTEYNILTKEIIDRVSQKTHPSIQAIYPPNVPTTAASRLPSDPPGDGEPFDKGDMWP